MAISALQADFSPPRAKINGAKTLPYQPPQPQTNKTRNTVSTRVARFIADIERFALTANRIILEKFKSEKVQNLFQTTPAYETEP